MIGGKDKIYTQLYDSLGGHRGSTYLISENVSPDDFVLQLSYDRMFKGIEELKIKIDITRDLTKISFDFEVPEEYKSKKSSIVVSTPSYIQQAERISYLKTLDLNTVEDETIRKIVEELVSSNLSRQDKVESVQKLVSQSAILSCLNKSEKLEPGQINSYALKTLKSLEKFGKNLSETQIIQAESAIATMAVDFNRIGKKT